MTRIEGWKSIVGIGAALIVGAAATPAATEGQLFSREGRWQFSIPINFVSGEKIDGDGGSFVDLNDDVGWGLAFGYNVNERFMVGFETTWLAANYDAVVGIDFDQDQAPDSALTIGGRLDSFNLMGVGQFNLLEGRRLTPFVQAKLGTSYTDSNIPSGPTQGGCWWDPWWGYICSTWRPTYASWSFAYGGAVGLRMQVGNQFFLEGSYGGLWVDLDQGTPSFDGFRLNVGWAY